MEKILSIFNPTINNKIAPDLIARNRLSPRFIDKATTIHLQHTTQHHHTHPRQDTKMLKDSYDTLSEETKPRSTNDGLHSGAFKKGTTSECRHRLIQRIKVFSRSSAKDGGTPDDAFKKETTPTDAVAAGLARTRQGLHPAPSTSEMLVWHRCHTTPPSAKIQPPRHPHDHGG